MLPELRESKKFKISMIVNVLLITGIYCFHSMTRLTGVPTRPVPKWLRQENARSRSALFHGTKGLSDRCG